MKTVAIFAGYLLPHLGGIERYVDNLTKELLKKGYRVILISSNYDRSFQTITKKDNLVDIRIPIYKLFRSRYPLIKHNKKLKAVFKELGSYKIDRIIVNTRFHLTSLLGAKYGHKNRIPVYLIEHGSSHLSINNKILDFLGAKYEHCLTSYLKRYVDFYYGVSQDACDWQKHFKIESNGIWYNSINRFDKGLTISKNNNETIILYAGRILKQKGVEELIESFLLLKNKHKRTKLIIAGDGDYLDYLKSNYQDKDINYLGKVDFSGLKDLYLKSNIFVHPSHYPEGLPTCILEAGLMECAIIATPNGGTRYFINNDNGIIIENKEELIKALDKCLSNKKNTKKIGKKIKETIVDNFTWDKTANKIVKDLGLE